MEPEDTQPWYRQFWPWFIIALPASAVIAGLYTVWLALQTGDSLVVHSDDGINVVTERNLSAEKEAQRLGLTATVNIEPDTGAVQIAISTLPGVQLPTSLELRMRHPTMASRDATIQLQRAMPNARGEATWAGHFISPPQGRLYMTLSSGDTWRLSSEWSGQPQVALGQIGQ